MGASGLFPSWVVGVGFSGGGGVCCIPAPLFFALFGEKLLPKRENLLACKFFSDMISGILPHGLAEGFFLHEGGEGIGKAPVVAIGDKEARVLVNDDITRSCGDVKGYAS